MFIEKSNLTAPKPTEQELFVLGMLEFTWPNAKIAREHYRISNSQGGSTIPDIFFRSPNSHSRILIELTEESIHFPLSPRKEKQLKIASAFTEAFADWSFLLLTIESFSTKDNVQSWIGILGQITTGKIGQSRAQSMINRIAYNTPKGNRLEQPIEYRKIFGQITDKELAQ